MTDREYLELAYRAYAPGENYIRMVNVAGPGYWNPITNDGDALRLAVKLGIVVEYRREVPACFAYHYALNLEVMQRNDQLDPCAATRRAIVRAAAEIGKGTKPFPTAREIREEWT